MLFFQCGHCRSYIFVNDHIRGGVVCLLFFFLFFPFSYVVFLGIPISVVVVFYFVKKKVYCPDIFSDFSTVHIFFLLLCIISLQSCSRGVTISALYILLSGAI